MNTPQAPALAHPPVSDARAAEPGLLDGARALFARDLRLAWRRRADALGPLVLCALVIVLFTLGVGPSPAQLTALGPGVLWVAALLASTLPLSHLWADDLADGTLDGLMLSPDPLALLVLARVAAHWVTTGLPLVLAAPLMALPFGLDGAQTLVLMASLALGTPVIALLGALGAALTLGLRGAVLLGALLVLPLLAPVLIFGAGAVQAQAAGLGATPHLSLLGAALLLAAPGAALATAAALRIATE